MAYLSSLIVMTFHQFCKDFRESRDNHNCTAFKAHFLGSSNFVELDNTSAIRCGFFFMFLYNK